MSHTIVGSVISLWRYPVKSMLGEELDAAEITERGLAGDRAYALVDRASGKVASAKNPVKWGKLFFCRAAFVEAPRPGEPMPPVRITLPDGAIAGPDGSEIGGILSTLLERTVDLRTTAPETPSLEEYWPDIDGLAHRQTVTDEQIAGAAPGGTFFDYALAHLLTTGTLDRLGELYPQGRFEARRFRPNFLVEPASGASGFVENDWVGRLLAIGDTVRLRVTDPCPRCVMTTLPQGDLPQDHGILRTAVQHNRVHVPSAGAALPSVGVYATVEQPGVVRRGDPVRLLD
ncbi:MAG: MOSC domain-containing protein [Acidobacteria bacterium]|nr:MOSC domain-containing protein [Acidobacteriota bacterium]